VTSVPSSVGSSEPTSVPGRSGIASGKVAAFEHRDDLCVDEAVTVEVGDEFEHVAGGRSHHDGLSCDHCHRSMILKLPPAALTRHIESVAKCGIA
jgi:hypothetical protein